MQHVPLQKKSDSKPANHLHMHAQEQERCQEGQAQEKERCKEKIHKMMNVKVKLVERLPKF